MDLIRKIWIMILVVAAFAVLQAHAGNAPGEMRNNPEAQEEQTIPREPPEHDVGRGPEHETQNDVYRGPRIPPDGVVDDNDDVEDELDDEENGQDNHDGEYENRP